MGKAYFDVSLQLLPEFLKLPKSARVTAIAEHIETLFVSRERLLRVFVESDDLPYSEEPIRVSPQYMLHHVAGSIAVAEFAGWGI